MNQLGKSWLKRRAREMRDTGIAVAAAFAGKLDKLKAPDEPTGLKAEGWDTDWVDEVQAGQPGLTE